MYPANGYIIGHMGVYVKVLGADSAARNGRHVKHHVFYMNFLRRSICCGFERVFAGMPRMFSWMAGDFFSGLWITQNDHKTSAGIEVRVVGLFGRSGWGQVRV